LKALEQKQLIEASEPVLATASTESFAAPTLSPAQTDTPRSFQTRPRALAPAFYTASPAAAKPKSTCTI